MPVEPAAFAEPPILPSSQGRHSWALPVPLTSFLARDQEIADVSALLRRDDVRLLTLTGPGGVGKTRLALTVAARLTGDFTDGAGFVSLAPVAHPDLVAPAVAQVLGVREAGNEPLVARLQAFLRERRLLLVLDNYEHVVDAAPLVTDLLGAAPDIRILVTSRTRLRLSGEHEHVVPPLALANTRGQVSYEAVADAPAVQLFIARAQAVQEAFSLTAENAAAVAAICRRLDGLPLAIELAAARVKVLSPPALLARLERRLVVLTGGGRDLPARQRTMRDAIAWSYALLAAPEQRLFRRLAVFAGGWTLEAAEAVSGGDDRVSILEGLQALARASLVQPVAQPDGEWRFYMLETLREFGLEQLRQEDDQGLATEQAHADYYRSLAEQAYVELVGAQQRTWLTRLDAEDANIRAALDWISEHG